MRHLSTIRLIGFVLLALAVAIGVLGYLNQHAGLHLGSFWDALLQDFYANVGTELASIAIIILIVDAIYERRDTEREKKALILQLSSPNKEITQEAARVLRMRGWLTDGSLQDANLRWANLRDGFLWRADLRGADFYLAELDGVRLEKANLLGAQNLTASQLVTARNLRRAKMPDGSKYDGRYTLEGDYSLAKRKKVDITSNAAMADFYDVPVDVYLDALEWAGENLHELQPAPPSIDKIPAKDDTETKRESHKLDLVILGMSVIAVVEIIRLFQSRNE